MRSLIAVIFAAALANAVTASAQPYPSRPITMIVPFPPGGPTDTIGRIIIERMRVSLGQPVIIENVGGAGGSIGVGRVARAMPDGYTIGIGNSSSHVFNGALYTLPYDLLTDFAPVSLLSSQPALIVARKDLPAKNLSEFIAWLKANPDKASQGSPGVGTASHVWGAFFQKQTGTRYQFVPYRGAGPAMQDLVAGQIDFMIDTPSTSLPQVRTGAIKAYAVAASRHLAAAPDIPTVDEAGLPGFDFSFWQGMWVPKGTAKNMVDKLNAAVRDALADSTVRQRLHDLGQDIPPPDQQTPKALGAYHKAETDKWWPIVKAANIRGE
jgi:tripartite-type tricarboxylate transporter receptor subunit TctC